MWGQMFGACYSTQYGPFAVSLHATPLCSFSVSLTMGMIGNKELITDHVVLMDRYQLMMDDC